MGHNRAGAGSKSNKSLIQKVLARRSVDHSKVVLNSSSVWAASHTEAGYEAEDGDSDI